MSSFFWNSFRASFPFSFSFEYIHVFFLLEGGTSSSASILTLVSSVDPVVFSDLSNSGLGTMGVNTGLSFCLRFNSDSA